ncbi:MAG: hypothetical protein CTY12_01400 [Methylotenera sp.]|nr:MAG: hypothetical protein CTY12_01400 [Methylotenera sp.]
MSEHPTMLINGVEVPLIVRPHENSSYQPINLPRIEDHYGGKFIGDFCTKHSRGGWNETPVAVFYHPNPDTSQGHTHYFGIFVQDGHLYITNAISVTEEPITGIVADNGEVIFSRYRHDYVTSYDDSVFIDGGRDYVRCNNPDRLVQLQIVDDKVTIVSTIPTTINKELDAEQVLSKLID